MATHSSILAWRIQWAEEPGGLQTMGLQRVQASELTLDAKRRRAHDCQLSLCWEMVNKLWFIYCKI